MESLDPQVQFFIGSTLTFIAGYVLHWFNNRVAYCPKCDINWSGERKCRTCGMKLITAKWCPQKKHGVIDGSES